MREIHVQKITAAVAELCRKANYFLSEDVVGALQKGLQEEVSPREGMFLDSCWKMPA